MPLAYDEYLRAWRFTRDPLETLSAEREVDLIEQTMVRQPWMAELGGAGPGLRSRVIFGARGTGKTAQRLLLARMIGADRASPGLVATLDDGGDLLALDPGHIGGYTRLLAGKILRALHAQLPDDRAKRLRQEQPQSYGLLYLAWQRFAPECTIGREQPDAGADLLGPLIGEAGSRELLRLLFNLTQACGYSRGALLFDSLDEGMGEASLPALAARLGPLLSNPGLLESCGFDFVFFLTSALREHFDALTAERMERLRPLSIQYQPGELCAILSLRLGRASLTSPTSRDCHVGSLANLCGYEDDWIDRALAATVATPRELLRLVRRIVERHCEQASSPSQPIALELVRQVVAAERGLELPEGWLSPPGLARSPSPAVPPLRLLKNGTVLVGDEQLRPLTAHCLRLLQLLWADHRKLLSYDALTDALYHGQDRKTAKDALRKVVERLRGSLEPALGPAASRSNTYIETHDGYGLRLRNYLEDGPGGGQR